MQPLDIWQAIGSPQAAEITALVGLALPFFLKACKRTAQSTRQSISSSKKIA
jgi:hypothetical protein